MIARMALEDIKALQGEGIEVTPDQIVTLHALAVRVTRGAKAAEFAAAPRTVCIGELQLYEPSLAAERWIANHAYVWFEEDLVLELALLWACANSHNPALFDAASTPEITIKLLKQFAKKVKITRAQALVALRYVIDGAIPAIPSEVGRPDTPKLELGETKEAEEAEVEDVKLNDGCCFTDIALDIRATGMALDTIELWSTPRRILSEMLFRWRRYRIALTGVDVSKLDNEISNRDYLRYQRYLDSLRAHGKKQ